MQRMTWFERLMDTAWKHSSASDSLYETGTEACLVIVAGAVVAGLVITAVLAGRVRLNTKTPPNTPHTAVSANSS